MLSQTAFHLYCHQVTENHHTICINMPSSVLLSSLLVLVATVNGLALPQPNAEAQTGGYNNGQPSQPYGNPSGYMTATYGAGGAGVATAPTPYPVYSSQASQASQGGWEYSVTWPAGCQTWANPCPSGAHISGGSAAGGAAYTNGFTSYLTETNSQGVITGMPSVATVGAGVTPSSSSSKATITTPTGTTSTTATAFSVSGTSTFAGGAAAAATGRAALLLGAAGFAMAMM